MTNNVLVYLFLSILLACCHTIGSDASATSTLLLFIKSLQVGSSELAYEGWGRTLVIFILSICKTWNRDMFLRWQSSRRLLFRGAFYPAIVIQRGSNIDSKLLCGWSSHDCGVGRCRMRRWAFSVLKEKHLSRGSVQGCSSNWSWRRGILKCASRCPNRLLIDYDVKINQFLFNLFYVLSN